MGYNETIQSLFGMLATANQADHETRQWWQVANDSGQRGYYGHIRSAIVSIAGKAIVEWWDETGEVDTNLANRFDLPD